jgi:pimeloyl-ACP methyl ester carboxylesterase
MEQVRLEAGQSLLEDVMDLPFPYVCSAWGKPDLGAQFRSPITTDVPVLFVSGSLDGRTPPENVLDILPGFTRSQHVIVEGGTHSSSKLVSVPQVRALMAAFLRGEPVTDLSASIPFTFAPLEE